MTEATDAEVLFPDRLVEIDGEAVTVREFCFREQMDFGSRMRPLLGAIEQAFQDENGAKVDDVIEDNWHAWVEMLVAATRKPREWVESLRRKDADALATAMWKVNEDFFLKAIARRRVVRERAEKAQE